jgi:hypothetical protein
MRNIFLKVIRNVYLPRIANGKIGKSGRLILIAII